MLLPFLIAAAGLVVAGCAGPADESVAQSLPSPSTSAAGAPSRSPAPVYSAAPPVYPTGPGGCRETGGWSPPQQAVWLAKLVRRGFGGNDIQIDQTFPLVCQPVQIQVQYWTVKTTRSGAYTATLTGWTEHYHDGRARKEFKAPEVSGACTGLLTAVTAGWPVADDEMPVSIDASGREAPAAFRGARVAYGRFTTDAPC